MLPIWFFTMALYFIASSSYSLLQRKYAQQSKIPLRLIPALVFGFFVLPLGIVTAAIIGDFWISWQWQTICLLTFAAVAIGTFNVAPFQINKHIDATQYIIISNVYTPITVLTGVFILGEAFTAVQFLGTLLLIFGAILVAAKGFSKDTFRFDKFSVELAILAILLGLGLAAEKASLSYMSKSTYMVIGWGLQSLVTFYLARKDLGYIRKIDRQDFIQLTQLGVARSGHVIGFFLSVALSYNVALIASLSSFRIPLVFIASAMLLHERTNLKRKVIGVIIATIGVIML